MTARDRRVLIIGGIIIGVALVAALLVNLTSGGGNEALPSFSPNPGNPGVPTPTNTNQQQPPPAAAGRDPFSIPPGLGPSATPGASGSPGGGGGGGGGGGSSTPPPTLPGNGSSTQIGGHTVVLVSVYPLSGVNYAQVEVDGVVYNPSVGAHFAGGEFLLRSTSGGCANFLFGDQSFSLCTNPQK